MPHRTGHIAHNRVTDEQVQARLSEFGATLVRRFQERKINGLNSMVVFTCGGRHGEACGKEITRSWNDLRDPRRTAYCQIHAQPRLRGKDHPQYRHDLPQREREDLRWRAADSEWQRKVLERDDFTCQISGQRGGRLQAHHLNSRTHFPEQKFDLANGITLTEEIHAEFHRRKGCKRRPTLEKFALFFQEKTGRAFVRHP